MIDITMLGGLLPVFGLAALRTLALVATGLAGGLALGFVAHVLRETGLPALRWLYWTYTAVWRGVPFLIHLFIVYFGLPAAGITMDPFTAAAVTLSVYGGAYFAEIFRGCWQAIPQGQVEAARCMGLSRRQVFLRIQAPQALRASLPLVLNQTILLMKESALASVITYPELTMTAGKVVSEQFVYIEPYFLLALSYLLLAMLIQRLGAALKRRLAC
ncbi:amino acid ABC transporter permease [Bordetella hinzii]|nr:amino acid ABC transporter permease [Bordetella hinzii]AKQ55761.1 putative glutamine ABC transporter permease protein GlnM [Bordetella hinzii]AKQ60294.1 putative glutamine ABC transporter permease protein GlnM [Bordetella hinzii]KCB50529.1 ABC transporter, permease protein [Bordetella hinzii 1277]MBZ0077469.1 amino acid ABC transporter permease [Bordetella hinzii]MBZ0081778.1 amino acid ABC transporter permease [Bordetella hinzii]